MSPWKWETWSVDDVPGLFCSTVQRPTFVLHADLTNPPHEPRIPPSLPPPARRCGSSCRSPTATCGKREVMSERSLDMSDILRHTSGTWSGDLQSGTGTASTESGALQNAKISFASRFNEPVTGSNPEELI